MIFIILLGVVLHSLSFNSQPPGRTHKIEGRATLILNTFRREPTMECAEPVSPDGTGIISGKVSDVTETHMNVMKNECGGIS